MAWLLAVGVFFLFKQKTAYEMRISDWSSDVCSSDLVVLAAGAGTAALAAGVGIDLPMTTPPGLLVHSRPHAKLLNGLVMAPELHMRQTAEEIGRASGRERVCQDV